MIDIGVPDIRRMTFQKQLGTGAAELPLTGALLNAEVTYGTTFRVMSPRGLLGLGCYLCSGFARTAIETGSLSMIAANTGIGECCLEALVT